MSFDKPFEHDEALYQAALREFTERGYEQASINTILQASGMSKGQFYYHFGSKEGLYLALAGVVIEKKRAFLTQVIKPEDFRQDLFGVLQAQVRYSLAFARQHPEIEQFSRSFIREKGSAIYAKALAVYNFEDDSALAALIDQAYRNGELRDDLPPAFVRHIIGYMFTHAVDIVDLTDTETTEQNLLHLIAFLKSGLARNDH